MRICDIKGCGKPAKEVAVDVNVATPKAEDFGAASIEGLRYEMDLCEGCLKRLHDAIEKFDPNGDGSDEAAS